MTEAEIVGIGLAIVGGAGVIAAFVGRLVAERSSAVFALEIERKIERLKSELQNEAHARKEDKKAELLIQKQIEAAAAFFALRQRIDPWYTHPAGDEDDLLQEVVDAFADIEGDLQNFAERHGIFLDEEMRKDLAECSVLACNYQFASPGSDDSEEAKETAREILKKLRQIEAKLVDELRYSEL